VGGRKEVWWLGWKDVRVEGWKLGWKGGRKCGREGERDRREQEKKG
jgi:hypothetical protein